MRLLTLCLKNTMVSLSLCALVNCTGQWDDSVVAPENFRSSYDQVHECKQSAHPAADYVVTWLSPDAQPVWEALSNGETDVEFEVGTVSVKSQYSDSNCSTLTGYTLMEKTSVAEDAPHGGWRWQYINEFGECSNCDATDGCAGCHSGCTSGPKFFCTQPESP